MTLFSTEKSHEVVPYEWASKQLDRSGNGYTLEDLYTDMRYFWEDPTYMDRAFEELRRVKQGRERANVFGARVRMLANRCSNREIADQLVNRYFLAGLHPAARQVVNDRIRDGEHKARRAGAPLFVPLFEDLVYWAAARDEDITGNSPHSSDRTSATPSRIAPASSLKSSVSPSNRSHSAQYVSPESSAVVVRSAPVPRMARDVWEKGAVRFQEKFKQLERASWPAGKDSAPPDGLNCWNCGKRGHWSLKCTNARVIPASATLSAVQAALYAEEFSNGFELEAEELIDEHALYGLADSTDLMDFA